MTDTQWTQLKTGILDWLKDQHDKSFTAENLITHLGLSEDFHDSLLAHYEKEDPKPFRMQFPFPYEGKIYYRFSRA